MAIVLLVDDQPAVLSIVGHMLTDAGYTVLTANSPIEAESDLGSADLALIDMEMDHDEQAGLKLVRRMRPMYPNLPMVILSMGSQEAEEARDRGEIQDCITKDWAFKRYKEFLKRLQKLLET